jgi:4-carboxymuconolactone decarboxylase
LRRIAVAVRVRRVSLQQDLEAAVLSPPGDPSLRCLALLHGASCIGRFDAVTALHALADRLAIPAARRREAALQVVAYGGFPRTIEGLALLAELPTGRTAGATGADERAESSATERRQAGRAVWDRIYAEQADEVLDWLGTLAPELPGWVLDDAYGRVLSRPGLSLAERELLGVAALALMGLSSPLASHVRGALRNGSNADSVGDILRACRGLAPPNALAVIDQALQRLDRNVLRP